MSPPDASTVPTKIPHDLWHDIQRVKELMLTFLTDAQLAAEKRSASAHSVRLCMDDWTVATAVQQM